MANCSIDTPVVVPVDGEEILKSTSYTSSWIDVSGWTDKAVGLEIDDSGTVDVNVTLHSSPQDSYTLNNKTATTEDYESISIVDAHTGKVYVQYDGSDVEELQRPMRSVRVFVENDEASTTSTVTVKLFGWS